MSTLAVVEAILREAAMPLSVREIVERAGDALPTKSKTPDTVVARDLSMDIKKRGDGSTFARTSPGRYAIREQTAMRTAMAPDKDDGGEVQPTVAVPQEAMPAASPGSATTTLGGPPASPPASIADPAAAATALVGQSLPHDRNGTRPAAAKAPSKPQNSEDTPMSA
jgi:hypothetical protein